jgi:transposase
LVLLQADGKRAVFLGGVAIYVYDVGDRAAESSVIAMLSRADLASDIAIGEAFGCHRNTVGRLRRRLVLDGMAGVVPAKRGPKTAHKVTAEVLEVVENERGSMSVPALTRLIAECTGVVLSVSHVRRLVAAVPAQLDLGGETETETERSSVQSDSGRTGSGPDGGVGSDDDGDVGGEDPTVTAAPDAAGGCVDHGQVINDGDVSVGFDPPAIPPPRSAGRYMGLALYYPAIEALGLLDVARLSFRLPRSSVFGVRAVVLSVFFMTLLAKTTVESAKHLRRAEFGALIGTGRAPCVKTLRRKLDDLVAQQNAAEFGNRLAQCWIESGIVASGYLYVDGHVKSYTGKRCVADVYSSKRRLALPGLHSYFVGDQRGRPLLLLTEALSPNLANAMPEIVASIRTVVGDQTFTVLFDRGGFDGKLFTWLTEQRIGFITYQRGEPNLADEAFVRRETRFEGRRVRLWLAEDQAWVNGRGPWRRIVVRQRNGHQVPILTNLTAGTGPARIVCLMFARWRQENLFKYMTAHHGLDQLISYGADPADPDALIPNPQRRQLERQITATRSQASKLKADLGAAVLNDERNNSVQGLKIAQRGAVGRLRALERDIRQTTKQRNALATHVTVAAAGIRREVLRCEHKTIVDRIKISAYNAEEWLLEHLVPHYPNPNDVRDLLRSFAELSGRMRTTANGVTITLDPPDTPQHRQALRGLITELNATAPTYPGTDLPVNYRVALHHTEVTA